MKKISQKRQAAKKTSRPKTTSKPSKQNDPGTTISSLADLAKKTKALATYGEQIHTRAHELDQEAHALHELSHQTATASQQMHGHHPAGGPDAGEIVTNDIQPGDGIPFPIVGIGASAGGYEAFAEFLQQIPE